MSLQISEFLDQDVDKLADSQEKVIVLDIHPILDGVGVLTRFARPEASGISVKIRASHP